MTPDARRLKEQALALPEGDRLELATELLASVGPAGEDVTQAEWERLWLAEADRRWREIEEGRARTVAAEDVLREIKAKFA
jgi:putative addiction module component (TIGR02574 family)